MRPLNGATDAARPAPLRGAAHGAVEPRARLRAAADELEAVFLTQLFQAMRASVPQDGIIERSSAEDTFTQMLDEMMARRAAVRMQGGVGEAMYQQLIRRLPPDGVSGE